MKKRMKKENSRSDFLIKVNLVKSKRSQVTIFIIIAVIIVGIALIIIFYPKIKATVIQQTPNDFMQSCVEQGLDPLLKNIINHGGSLEPENFVLYNDNKIEYLCYTNEYYKTCTNQQPLLKQHIEEELSNHLKQGVDGCINSLAVDYENKGYQVSRKKSNISVEIVPGDIKIIIDAPLTLTKESSQSFEKFSVAKTSDIYDLVMIASSILNFEARYGDSTPESYMLLYPNIKVEKLKQDDGSKIYTLTARDTGEEFIFATRSLAWPAGYGTQEVLK